MTADVEQAAGICSACDAALQCLEQPPMFLRRARQAALPMSSATAPEV
jgi:hypothetical protein